MFCTNCGAKIGENEKTCSKCGMVVEKHNGSSAEALKILGNNAKEAGQAFVKNMAEMRKEQVLSTSNDKALIEPDEQILATLGNGYFINLMFGNVKKCRALLTNKRLYVRGKMLTGNGKDISKTCEERILDLEDITGTGFIYGNLSLIKIIIDCILGIALTFYLVAKCGRWLAWSDIAVAVITGAILSITLIVLHYQLSKSIYFVIEYAGGKIKINAKLIGQSDVEDFHKQIRRAKDMITGKK